MGRDENIQKIIASQLDTRFFPLKIRPGWRVLVMQQPDSGFLDILFTWNHPHADGMSGKIFHELLLEALSQLKGDRSQDDKDSVLAFRDSSGNFPPPIEKVARLPVEPLFVLKEAWHEYKPASILPRATQANWAPIRTHPYKTRFQTMSIPHSVFSKVLIACHDRETTLTGLLNSLVLTSLAAHIKAKEASAFASSTAIDQRRFVPSHPHAYEWLDPTGTIGNYVSIMTHEFDSILVAKLRSKLESGPTGGDLSSELLDHVWSTATQHVCGGEIAKRLEMGLHNDVLGLARFVLNWKKQFLRDVKKPRKLSWFVTNLGVFDGKPMKNTASPGNAATEWRIRRAQFTLSTEIPVAALLLGVSSVKHQELVVTCTWQDTVVEESLVDGLLMDMKKWLVQIGN
ncbi:hypothetical protein BU23DRAFT_267370 [Bimuria novae-zelandiae CBS 107.79]|uniref:Alcohol acetyltransferase n=1 Tax=Bimuria novae-zelandiae CBS 107.79 TaxID=1447943 RepID=A0A6A5UU97_9PLEO|nr:hypothetical protein BU23DRAFT_267370 [Bimuria novae-zelandiae CBS 107.79]